MVVSARQPRVSIVIPCYNLGAYLEDAVNSCLEQSLECIDILVVDDGSDEPETRALLATYRPPKTRILSTPNRGLASARNLGWREAQGEYVCFLDADDKLHAAFFEKAVRRLDAEAELAFVSCWIEAFGDEDWTFRPERCDLPSLLADCSVATAALVRRRVLEDVGGFDEGMPEQGDEDWDLWIRLLCAGHSGTILPEVLFYYRRRQDSMVERCYYGQGHLVLMDYLFRKHQTHYRRHLDAVIRLKALELRELQVNFRRLVAHLADDVLPRLERAARWHQDAEEGAGLRALQTRAGELTELGTAALSEEASPPPLLPVGGVSSPDRPEFWDRLMSGEERLLRLRCASKELELCRRSVELELSRIGSRAPSGAAGSPRQ